MISTKTLVSLLLAASLTAGWLAAAETDLATSFHNPPDAAKPLTWWHWVDGNVTRAGITADLEAMQRAGLGGCYLFNIGGYFPEGQATFLTPQWLELLDHTVREAERLGLVFGVHNCDGWSESGGPWIRPEQSMKVLTHSVLEVEGPRALHEALPQPPSQEGVYHDIAWVAFPVPADRRLSGPGSGATVTSSLVPAKSEALADGRTEPAIEIPARQSGNWIEFALPEARPLRSLMFHRLGKYPMEEDFPVRIETSTNRQDWKAAGSGTFSWDTERGEKPVTMALAGAPAQFVRLSFTNPWPVTLGEIELSEAAKVHLGEAKSGFLRRRGHGGETVYFDRYPGPDRRQELPGAAVVRRDQVINLAPFLSPDGQLTWNVPAGRWRLLRVGYTSNGRLNRPATSTGVGLECDKLDPAVVRHHLEQYVGKLVQRYGPAVGKTLRVVETDSWECDIQNWTAGLERRFQEQTGADWARWLPLLLEGWVMDSRDASERFLWDWRRFLADQLRVHYFDEVARYLKAKGFTYVAEGAGRQQYLYDPLGYHRSCDVPMGEFWINTGPGQGVRPDNKVAASAAHIRGLPLVAAESYTASAPFAQWRQHPCSLKPLGDRAYCAGVNQFVFHTFAHQPYPVAGPGFTMAIYGLNFNRANTWWEPGRAWLSYLTRCNHLLREGRFVADVLWFIGEDVPNRIGWRDELQPPLPAGYDFDGCDAATLAEAQVRDGRIVLPSGMEYAVLLLSHRATLRPAVLRQIARLVEAGATVLGPRPTQSPSLADLGEGDRTVARLAEQVWGRCDGATIKDNLFGRGRVFWGLTFPELFARLQIAEDFQATPANTDAEILYLHRRSGDADLYFVSNQKMRPEKLTATFRVAGRQPELWAPDTGAITRPACFRQTPAGVELPLTLDPAGSVFVVFRQPSPPATVTATSPADLEVSRDNAGGLWARAWQPAEGAVTFSDGRQTKVPAAELPAPAELAGPWTVRFPAGLGAPPSAVFDRLISWPQHPEEGIRYFSGTAVYEKEFTLAADRLEPGRELWLDLGRVEVIAEVTLNGKNLGILWKPPFRLEATAAAQAGTNRLSLRVTSLWPNRMIGDEQKPDTMEWQAKRPLPARWPEWLLAGQPRPDGRITFCTRKVFRADEPLLESGLIGPVRLESARRLKL